MKGLHSYLDGPSNSNEKVRWESWVRSYDLDLDKSPLHRFPKQSFRTMLYFYWKLCASAGEPNVLGEVYNKLSIKLRDMYGTNSKGKKIYAHFND